MAIGIDAQTGRALGGIAHLRQSVRDILTTPVGSRVLLRDYGCGVADLLDRPANAALLAAVQAEAADALARWEPRLRLRRVRAERSGSSGSAPAAGRLAFSLEGRLADGTLVRFTEGIA